ncbi:MAG TPA: type II toxin-antitoxin system prevent-host-death family antitoxin, partial [Myxococcales bacterium]|nr:type II toxin-antitoxin system prevent-host-death family antitoxin [Myxococcales bacterium]
MLITRRGRRIAAVISIAELKRLRELPPAVDPIEESNRAWDEGKRWLEEHLARLAEERARAAQQQSSVDAGGHCGRGEQSANAVGSDGDAAARGEVAGDG